MPEDEREPVVHYAEAHMVSVSLPAEPESDSEEN